MLNVFAGIIQGFYAWCTVGHRALAWTAGTDGGSGVVVAILVVVTMVMAVVTLLIMMVAAMTVAVLTLVIVM